MKYTVALLASGLATASAGSLHARHLNFHGKRSVDVVPSASVPTPSANSSCGCRTYTTTWYGTWALVPEPTTYAAETNTSTSLSTSTSSSTWSEPTNTTTWSEPTSSSTWSESISSSTWSASSWSSSSSSASPTSTSSSSSTWVAPTTASSSETTSSTSVAPTTSSWSSSSSSSTFSTSSWAAETTSKSAWFAPSSYVQPSSYDAPSSSSSWTAPSASSYSGNGGNSGGGQGSISPNGNQWAMTYTPYANDGGCKSYDDIQSDVSAMAAKGFTTVRLYATDCDGVSAVGDACDKHGMKVILGIYIDGAGIGSSTDEQVSSLTQWGQNGNWGKVEMVVAGNEAIFNGYCSASDLAGFVGDVKSKFQAAGYTGPVTTTEPLGTIQGNADTICAAVDVIGANIHPFFNSDIDANDAGDFVASQLEDLAAACNHEKEAYNLETGWPSASTNGGSNGVAIPGFIQQKIAIKSIMDKAGSKSAIFSFQDDMWKSPGDLGVEQYWGCSSLFSD